MSRLFVVGPCPYWAMPEGKFPSAKNVRVWQLLQPLLADGHEILHCITDIGKVEPSFSELPNGYRYETVSSSCLGWRRKINRLCREFSPEALIAVMWQNGVLSLCLPPNLPLWVDLFGYPLGEIQVIFNRNNNNRLPLSAIAFYTKILQRCDVLSTGGQRHAYATIGELGIAARLNRYTLGYTFVHAIQPGIAPAPFDTQINKLGVLDKSDQNNQIRLLWIGGYNAWTDVDTLFDGISLALKADPSLVFVSTGGAIESVDSSSYPRFLQRIAASPYRERYQMLGWVSAEELDYQLSIADIGMVVDADHYETLLGTRTRLVDMMSRGIPVVTTLGCELSYIIRDHGAGETCPSGDPKALAKAILTLSKDPSRRHKSSENALHLMVNELSAARTTTPLRDWAKCPKIAPDRLNTARYSLINKMGMNLRKWAKLALWNYFGRFG